MLLRNITAKSKSKFTGVQSTAKNVRLLECDLKSRTKKCRTLNSISNR